MDGREILDGVDSHRSGRSGFRSALGAVSKKLHLRASRSDIFELNSRQGVDNAAVVYDNIEERDIDSHSSGTHQESERDSRREREASIDQEVNGARNAETNSREVVETETDSKGNVERSNLIQREEKKPDWDKPSITPLESSKESDEDFYKICKKILKAFTIFFMIPAMIALLVLSKGSLLIAASNLKPYLHGSISQNDLQTSLDYSETRTELLTYTSIYISSDSYSIEPKTKNELTSLLSTSSDMKYPTSTLSPGYNFASSQGSMTCTGYDKTVRKTVGNRTEVSTSRVSKCVTIPHGFKVNGSQFSCLSVSNSSNVIYSSGITYKADQCFVMRNYWMWSLFLILCTPHVFIFMKCLWNTIFKGESELTLKAVLVVFVVETVYTVGISLLTFLVLPSFNNSIDSLLIMLTVAVVPSILKFAFSLKSWLKGEKRACTYVLSVILNFISILIQVLTIIIWPINVLIMNYEANKNIAWALPIGMLLTSVRWWENYYKEEKKSDEEETGNEENESMEEQKNKTEKIKKDKGSIKRQIERGREKIMLIVSPWKIGITVIMMMLCVSLQVEEMDPLHDLRPMNPWTAVFNFDLSWCDYEDEVTQKTIHTLTYIDLPELEFDWIWVGLVNCISSLFAYFFARSAAKMHLQRACYSFPLLITTPLMFGLMIWGCEIWNDQPCRFATNNLSGYLFYNCYEVDTLGTSVVTGFWFLFLIWWLSQLWITSHVWFPQNERLATAERLFVLPLYDGILLEQSLLLNRRKDDAPVAHITKSDGGDRNQGMNYTRYVPKKSSTKSKDDEYMIPYIYICATMWHETKDEMISMLKSIFRLDMDQENKKKSYESSQDKEETEYYQFEAHIFFDNAFDVTDDGTKVNEYVENLISAVTPAAQAVYTSREKSEKATKSNRKNKKNRKKSKETPNSKPETVTIDPPEIIKTPYGGRLIWTMRGGNKIIAHLKDSAKIRHKKRWSQVMYMYYFLGYKLLMDEELKKNENRLKLKAQSTFLLALDGDVDFEPLALQLVVDLMRRDHTVGAACGRIHPTGSGPMVWYQLFEYALGHWMQKSTEHVIGSVLCSPGCFSLFRGSALMTDNVMAKYTTKSTEPMHYIQYDQGEDRWLCTLLLQAGHRVEYCAASDSFTNAPESFEEFFNQRRRWMPSTMANILDLLKSYRHTTKKNENISKLYILYQLIIFLASVVGPGTIFMMIVGAMEIALGDKMDFTWSLILNLIPVLIFILLCYCAKPNTQMLVLVGLILEMANNGLCFPTTIFFLFVAGSFILCGILHPQEFLCVLHGCTYYLAIPTMYMLLVIYALCNLNEVSWGTREVKKTETEKQIEEDKKTKDDLEKKKSAGIIGGVLKNVSKDKDGCSIGCGNICGLTCCLRPVTAREMNEELNRISSNLEIKIEQLLSKHQLLVSENVNKVARSEEVKIEMDYLASMQQDRGTRHVEDPQQIPDENNNNDDIQDDNAGLLAGQNIAMHTSQMPTSQNPNLINSTASQTITVVKNWWDDSKLGNGKKSDLEEDQKENQFFKDLIKKYLKPLKKNKIQEERLTDQLRDLKNSVSMSFLLINAIFVVVVTVLQMNVATLFVPWPCGDDVKIEPLGFVFMLTFGVILIIQMSGMLLHRTSTFLHIMSTTKLKWRDLKFWKSKDKVEEETAVNRPTNA